MAEISDGEKSFSKFIRVQRARCVLSSSAKRAFVGPVSLAYRQRKSADKRRPIIVAILPSSRSRGYETSRDDVAVRCLAPAIPFFHRGGTTRGNGWVERQNGRVVALQQTLLTAFYQAFIPAFDSGKKY